MAAIVGLFVLAVRIGRAAADSPTGAAA
jgi:hypothetical protein